MPLFFINQNFHCITVVFWLKIRYCVGFEGVHDKMTTQRHSGMRLDADVRARIQESHERAKFVLEASKQALDAQTQQQNGAKRMMPPSNGLDISNLFGHQSISLPCSGPSKEPNRRSLSPRPSFDPVHDDMQSTRKNIIPEEDFHTARTSTRAMRIPMSPREMGNRSGARAVAANLNGTTIKDLSVNDILAGSRSERVRRMSQVPSGKSTGKNGQTAAIAMFEQDENNFIAEIPSGFAPKSPPTCQTPLRDVNNRLNPQYTNSAKIPIHLDDFAGEGYLLRKLVKRFLFDV